MKFVAFAILVAALLAGCGAKQDCPTTPAPAAADAGAAGVPDFIRQQLSSPHALRAKLYIASAGHVRKYAVYVTKDAIPAWVLELADEKLGPGEDQEYEVEQYEDGDQVYEITRIVDGQQRELSVKLDRTVKYVETPLAADALPEPVRAAVEGVSGFEPEQYVTKQGPDLEVYQVKGHKDGSRYRLDLDADGKINSQSRELDAGLVVDVEP